MLNNFKFDKKHWISTVFCSNGNMRIDLFLLFQTTKIYWNWFLSLFLDAGIIKNLFIFEPKKIAVIYIFREVSGLYCKG